LCNNNYDFNFSEVQDYLTDTQKGRDIFKRFEIYFNDVEKYECSFKEFATKYFEVLGVNNK
jgi:hypothetical protein